MNPLVYLVGAVGAGAFAALTWASGPWWLAVGVTVLVLVYVVLGANRRRP